MLNEAFDFRVKHCYGNMKMVVDTKRSQKEMKINVKNSVFDVF